MIIKQRKGEFEKRMFTQSYQFDYELFLLNLPLFSSFWFLIWKT